MYIDSAGNQWLKGNLHLHTTNSDGRKTPEEACQLYRESGYDFLSITDHWKMSDSGDYNGMVLIPGCEYNVGNTPREGIYHILSIGTSQLPLINNDSSAQQMIDAIHAAGGLAGLAHPAWSLNSTEQICNLHNVDFTEIFNSVSDLPHNARPYSGLILDTLAANGYFYNLAATDDAHFYEPCDQCRSFVYVQALECNEQAILTALKTGRFYASQGPQMDVRLENGKVIVDCSPVDEIVYYSDTVFSPARSQIGKNMTHSEYKPHDSDTYVRVEIRNSLGQYAWSQYIKF